MMKLQLPLFKLGLPSSSHLYQRYTQFSVQPCLGICEIIWRSLFLMYDSNVRRE